MKLNFSLLPEDVAKSVRDRAALKRFAEKITIVPETVREYT